MNPEGVVAVQARGRKKRPRLSLRGSAIQEEHRSLPGFNPDLHFPSGTTVDFVNRVVIGHCYDFEAGQELTCRRCGSRDTKDVVREGPVRCSDGPVAGDAGITKCNASQLAYIWRICTD